MDWNLFWVAFSSIGTTLGVFVAAISILIALKPYKKQFVVKFGGTSMTPESPIEYYIECYNAGETIYLSSINISYKKRTVIDCPINDPVLFKKNSKFSYDLSDEDVDTINFYLKKCPSGIFDIYLYDIQEKHYHNKIDLSWHKVLLDALDEIKYLEQN